MPLNASSSGLSTARGGENNLGRGCLSNISIGVGFEYEGWKGSSTVTSAEEIVGGKRDARVGSSCVGCA